MAGRRQGLGAADPADPLGADHVPDVDDGEERGVTVQPQQLAGPGCRVGLVMGHFRAFRSRARQVLVYPPGALLSPPVAPVTPVTQGSMPETAMSSAGPNRRGGARKPVRPPCWGSRSYLARCSAGVPAW